MTLGARRPKKRQLGNMMMINEKIGKQKMSQS